MYDLESYQKRIKGWDVYPDSTKPGVYLYGIMAELGEVANKYKKVFRDHGGQLEQRQKDYALEIGDLFWYATRLANWMGFTLEEILDMNLEKLQSRFDRGKIHGDGDSR